MKKLFTNTSSTTRDLDGGRTGVDTTVRGRLKTRRFSIFHLPFSIFLTLLLVLVFTSQAWAGNL